MEFSGLSKGIQHVACLAKALYKKRAKIVVYFVIIGFHFPCIAFFLGGVNGASEMYESMVGSDTIFVILIGGVSLFSFLFKRSCIRLNLNKHCTLYEVLDELSSLLGNILLIISGYCLFIFLMRDVTDRNFYGFLSIAILFIYALLEYLSNSLVAEWQQKAERKG
ncbi:hypothetical protein [Yersinia mollaretii]|uniref:hypothetical protein n=1 Tax=Yersinia mollaretii TaxID=33060 RepID=UPI0011A35C5D|nr:hypothetical protein [Yersinia mollaretii]MDN0109692.1 hypothetical protein [Yersinia mollaretii]